MARPWRGAAALLFLAASVPTSLVPPATPAAAGAPANRLRVSIVGDSVAASLTASPSARRALGDLDLALDARVCRRTASPGCAWRGDRPASVRDVIAATPGGLGEVVVIVAGYNDDARRFRADALTVLRDLGGQRVRRVVWLDLRTTAAQPPADQARQRSINATLAALDRVSPLLQVAPWNAASAGHADWFFDPIHLRSTGAVHLARFVRAHLGGLAAPLRPEQVPARSPRCRSSNGIGAPLGPAAVSPAPAARLVAAPPVALADTRATDADLLRRPLGRGRELRVDVAGRGPVPLSAAAAVVRVTVPATCGPGRLEVGGCGLAPVTRTGLARGRPSTVTVRTPLGAFGRVCVRTGAQADVRVELVAWSGPRR